MVDLSGIVEAGAEYSEGADKVLSAIDKAVIYKRNGSDHSDACGLAAYYPLELQGSAELKIFGDVAVSPYYLSFVDRTVYGSTNSGNTENYDNSSIFDLWFSTDETDDSSDYWDNYGECEATGDSPLIVFYDKPQLLDDGTYGFSLTDESLEYTASVQACVYMLSEDMEDIIELDTKLNMATNPPTTLYIPKSVTPNALRIIRDVNNPITIMTIIRKYNATAFFAMRLLLSDV